MEEPSSPARSPLARVSTVVQVMAVVPLVAMMVHITANAVSRRFLGRPFSDTLEITEYWYLPLVVAFGFVLAVNTGEHIDAPLLYQKFSPAARLYATAIAAVTTLAVVGAFAYYTLTSALNDMSVGRTGGFNGLVIWPATFALPFAFVSMFVLFAVQFRRKLQALGALVTDTPTDDSEVAS